MRTKKVLSLGLFLALWGILAFGSNDFAIGSTDHEHDHKHIHDAHEQHGGCGTCHTDEAGSSITRENPQLNAHGLKLQETAKQNETKALEAELRIYEVFGMDCPGCHGGLNKLVEKIPAVQTSEANWKEQRVTVTVKPGATLNDEDVYDAIKRANFTPGKRLK